jgi:hypothetical protein
MKRIKRYLILSPGIRHGKHVIAILVNDDCSFMAVSVIMSIHVSALNSNKNEKLLCIISVYIVYCVCFDAGGVPTPSPSTQSPAPTADLGRG